MPCRYIREEYLTSERVDALDVNAERFYFRLFLVVDDYGRYDANERLLKSRVYPLKDEIRTTDIARFLTACEKADLITLYTVAGKPYLEIKRFSQTRANCRSGRSKYPPPPTVGNNLQANANNLQAIAAENENENESENDKNANAFSPEPGDTGSPGNTKIPKFTISFDYEGDRCFHGIPEEMLEKWRKDFPAIDVEHEIRSAGVWLDSHRANRKSNLYRFLGNWLRRAQDRAPGVANSRIAADSAEIQPDNVL